MRLVIHSFQLRRRHVRVDLCRRKTGVAEEFFDSPQICSPIEQMRGHGMPKDVRTLPPYLRNRPNVRTHKSLHKAGVDRTAAVCQENRICARSGDSGL